MKIIDPIRNRNCYFPSSTQCLNQLCDYTHTHIDTHTHLCVCVFVSFNLVKSLNIYQAFVSEHVIYGLYFVIDPTRTRLLV